MKNHSKTSNLNLFSQLERILSQSVCVWEKFYASSSNGGDEYIRRSKKNLWVRSCYTNSAYSNIVQEVFLTKMKEGLKHRVWYKRNHKTRISQNKNVKTFILLMSVWLSESLNYL